MRQSGEGRAAPAVVRTLLVLLAIAHITTAQMPAQKAPGPPPTEARQTAYGVRATSGSEVLEVTVCSESVIHVVATPMEPEAKPSPRPWILDGKQSCPGAPFTRRNFRIVLVDAGHGAGAAVAKTSNVDAAYVARRFN